MQHTESAQPDALADWDWRAALKAHPIGRYGGLAWLADTLAMPRRTVYAYSAGQRTPTITWLRSVANVLEPEGIARDDADRTSG